MISLRKIVEVLILLIISIVSNIAMDFCLMVMVDTKSPAS